MHANDVFVALLMPRCIGACTEQTHRLVLGQLHSHNEERGEEAGEGRGGGGDGEGGGGGGGGGRGGKGGGRGRRWQGSISQK